MKMNILKKFRIYYANLYNTNLPSADTFTTQRGSGYILSKKIFRRVAYMIRKHDYDHFCDDGRQTTNF